MVEGQSHRRSAAARPSVIRRLLTRCSRSRLALAGCGLKGPLYLPEKSGGRRSGQTPSRGRGPEPRPHGPAESGCGPRTPRTSREPEPPPPARSDG
ncbi:MAG: lipoprotein [Chromatiales bacterium]|nr:lipoprotein [Chromatiales bacterium]